MGTRIGEMKCINPACSCTDVAVEVTGAGTWQAKCHKCGAPTFAKTGTKWRRDLEAAIVLDEQPTEKTTVKPPKGAKTEPEQKPEPTATPTKPARSVFDLASLT